MIHTDSSILLEYFSLFRNIKVLSYSILQSLIDVHCISELVATLQLFLSLNSINVFRREFSSARSNIFTSTWSRSFNNNDIFNCRTLFSPLSCSDWLQSILQLLFNSSNLVCKCVHERQTLYMCSNLINGRILIEEMAWKSKLLQKWLFKEINLNHASPHEALILKGRTNRHILIRLKNSNRFRGFEKKLFHGIRKKCHSFQILRMILFNRLSIGCVK